MQQWTVIAASVFTLQAAALPAQSTTQADTTKPKTPTIKVQPIARLQVQYSTTSVDEAELVAAGRTVSAIPTSNFEVRRMRFGAEVEVDKWLKGVYEMEFAMGRLQMRSVYGDMMFSPQFQLRVGQFKKPFSLLELMSENVWPVIERGVRIRGLTDQLLKDDSVAGGTRVVSQFKGVVLPGEAFAILDGLHYSSYDLGASVRGAFGGLTYDLGIFNGVGSDSNDDNDAKSIVGRLTYKLPTEMPITVGVAAGRREFRTATKPTITSDGGNAVEADFEIGAFRRPGIRLIGEVSTGRNLAFKDDFVAAQGIAAYFQPVAHNRVEGIEFAGRASYGDPRKDTDDDEGLLLTPGFNVYFTGRNRLMINWDVYKALGDRLSGANALRVQAQLYY